MADRACILRDGRLFQEGAPEEIYNHPATKFAATSESREHPSRYGGQGRHPPAGRHPDRAAWRERRMNHVFEHYTIAKKRAETQVVLTDLDWVVRRPSALTNRPGTGVVVLSLANRRDSLVA